MNIIKTSPTHTTIALNNFFGFRSVMECFILALAVATCCLSTTTASVIQLEPGGGQTNHSLQGYLCGADRRVEDDTTFVLSPGLHEIDEGSSCVVSDRSNLAIVSDGGARIVCTSNILGRNFIFLNISNLTLENVQVENCGAVVPPDLPAYVNNTFIYIDAQQKAVFLFAHITDLHAANLSITRSFGFAAIGVNLQGDTRLSRITVTDTDNFRHPMCSGNELDLSCSGSGLVFIYSELSNSGEFSLEDTTLTLEDSTLTDNTNLVHDLIFAPIFLTLRGSFELDHLLLTGATAMGVYSSQRSYNVSVHITSSVLSRNYGYASALAFLVINTIRNIHVEVEGCVIEGNRGTDLARGGGMIFLLVNYISNLYRFPDYPPDVHDLLTVRASSLLDNTAETGGAAYFFLAPQNVSDFRIVFDDVTFARNRAVFGSGFEADTRQATFVQRSIHFLLQDVRASNNTFLRSARATLTIPDRTATFVFLRIFNATVSGHNSTHYSSFSDNSPGPFLMVRGSLYLKGHIEFTDNKAQNGGALSLYDYSLLFLFESSRITFTRNLALQAGGAIYGESPDIGTTPTCLFQIIGPSRIFSVKEVDQLDLILTFINNTAVAGGNSIYVTPFYNCASLPESSLVDIALVYNSSALSSAIFKFQSTVNNGLSEISSSPEGVCFCEPDKPFDATVSCAILSRHLSVLPGQMFSVDIYSVDQQYQPVSSIVFVDVDSPSHSLADDQRSMSLDSATCTPTFFNLYGEAAPHVSLALYTQRGSESLKVVVEVVECPPGFVLSSENGVTSCICDPFVTEVLQTTCNFTTYTVDRNPPGSWLGLIDHENFSDVVYVATCPVGYCKPDLISADLSIEDHLCQVGRTGHLCGQCKANLSVVFGSSECMLCSNFWLFTILLYAAAGIILVVFLYFLNVTTATGSIHGITIIFYANIISLNSNLLLFSNDRTSFLFIWISLLNLELGFPLCFYDGMTEVAKAGLQCIFPLYLLLICLCIILISRWSSKVSNLVASSSIQVLATLIYLSFSKMLRYVIDIFSYGTLRSAEVDHSIWWYDGNLEYFTGQHAIIVFIPAAITLCFIIFYTLSMVLIKQIEKYTIRLKPLLDAYAGPFKDRYRFWFGLRLVVLAAMCVTFAIWGTDDPRLAISIQLLVLVLFMVIQAFLRPFRHKILNIGDMLYLMDLYILLLYVLKSLDSPPLEQIIIVNIIVGFGFLLFLLAILYHICSIPIVKAKLEILAGRVKQLYLSTAAAVHRKNAPEDAVTDDTHGDIKLTSLNQQSSEYSTAATSSTVVSLDTAINVDLKRKQTFSKLREPIMDY